MRGDCLDKMEKIKDHSVDLILCDLPYGTTACSWDSILDMEQLWSRYRRVIRKNGAIVLTAGQPFTTALINSNSEWFKYSWVWEKNHPSGFAQAKNKPLAAHEDILIFSSGVTVHASQSKNRMPYFPQGLERIDKTVRNGGRKEGRASAFVERKSHKPTYMQEFTGYPRSVLKFNSVAHGSAEHPTQKPVDLMEYLIKTYSNAGQTVLDNCMGSGTTGVAAVNTGRNFIGIEKDASYYHLAVERIRKTKSEKYGGVFK